MHKNSIKIGENDLRATDLASVNRLMKQLNPEAVSVDLKKVKSVMQFSVILTLRDSSKGNVLIGMGTLVPIKKLFAFCGSIEDIVVEEIYRGQGLGKKIMKGLLGKSKILGMKFVDLTSSPERESANKLYQSLGFTIKKTNLYRLYNYIPKVK